MLKQPQPKWLEPSRQNQSSQNVFTKFFRISMQETSTPPIFVIFYTQPLQWKNSEYVRFVLFLSFLTVQTKNNLICFVFSQLFRKTKQLEQTQFAPGKVGKHLHPHPLCLSALIWHRHTQVIWRVANQVIQLRKYTNSLRFGRKNTEIPKFSPMKSYEKLFGGNVLATLEMHQTNQWTNLKWSSLKL